MRSKGNDVYSISNDNKNNSYVVGSFVDSLFIDSQYINKWLPAGLPGAFLIKFDPYGNFNWCRILHSTGGVYLRHIQVVNDNKILVYGYLTGSKVKFTNNDSILNSGNNIVTGFITYYDSLGSYLNSSKIFTGTGYGSKSIGSDLFNSGQIAIDSLDNIYIKFDKDEYSGVINYKKGSLVLKDSIARFILIKYSPDFDSVHWYKEFPEIDKFQLLKIRMGIDNNLYLACHTSGANFNLGNRFYRYQNYPDKGFLSIISSDGTFMYGDLINSDTTQSDNFLDVGAIDTNNIYISGYVSDSILYHKKWFRPIFAKFKSGYAFPYVGIISIHSGAKWITFSEMGTPYSSVFNPSKIGNQICRLAFDKHGYFYFSFINYSGINPFIGGLTDNYKEQYVFVKLDKLGNALWLRQYKYKIKDINPTQDDNIVYLGNGNNADVFLNPFTLKFNKKLFSFIAKSNDYAINREDVNPGPYCAGDTFSMPYHKYGEYDTSNFFIAELSDENGEFIGKERELGRLKTRHQGKILCTIPNFKVYTSKKYRLRIRSTSPPVQSFYRYDTLKLLIYSTDKADPGPEEAVCIGDTIELNTFGGTKWKWSPAYNMDNPDLRNPRIWPKKDTVYRIIISDSSGCGLPDTAYKKIYMRPSPHINLSFKDTSLCQAKDISMIANFSGGDTLDYVYQWLYVNSPNSFFYLRKGQGALSDTFKYTPTDPKTVFAVVLSDGCARKNDTAFITLNISSKIDIKSNFKDTTLCVGNKLTYKANASGGVPQNYNWQWKDLSNNKILSNADTLSITADKSMQIQLSIEDGCKAFGDSGLFNITVNPVLKGNIINNSNALNDTLLCFGKDMKLSGIAQGGKGSGYNYKWYLDDILVSSKDTFSLLSSQHFSSSGETKKLKLMISDHCSTYPDSVIRNIQVVPSPLADFTWGLTCSNTPVSFTFTGKTPTITTYNWQFPTDSSNQKNPTKVLSVGKNQVYLELISQDGCKDEIAKNVDVLLQAKADFEANDVCEDSVVKFNNLSKGALSYKWSFGDGQTSDLDSPRHLYTISGSTTFNVKLLAKSGCSDSIIKAVTIHEIPNSNFTYTTSGTLVSFSALQTNASLYEWDFGDGGTQNTSSPNTTYRYSKFPSGKYNACLKISNLADCFSETCQEIHITGTISRINKENEIKIYPNPNQGNFTVELTEEGKNDKIEVYNTIGILIHKTELNQKVSQVNLDLSEGIYLIKLFSNGEVYFNKIVVEK
ncbi:MAG: PKD domain-containing protein [Flavobacteriales bacterium]|nr:PKD domain-containing protein [Flavobacteriales bacterium]